MLYLLAILLPPVAVLLVGRPIIALLNLFLCLFFYVPGIVHALILVHNAKADKRQQELIKALKENGK